MTTTSDVKRAAVAELDAIVAGLGVQEVFVLRYVAGWLAEGLMGGGTSSKSARRSSPTPSFTWPAELRRVLVRAEREHAHGTTLRAG